MVRRAVYAGSCLPVVTPVVTSVVSAAPIRRSCVAVRERRAPGVDLGASLCAPVPGRRLVPFSSFLPFPIRLPGSIVSTGSAGCVSLVDTARRGSASLLRRDRSLPVTRRWLRHGPPSRVACSYRSYSGTSPAAFSRRLPRPLPGSVPTRTCPGASRCVVLPVSATRRTCLGAPPVARHAIGRDLAAHRSPSRRRRSRSSFECPLRSPSLCCRVPPPGVPDCRRVCDRLQISPLWPPVSAFPGHSADPSSALPNRGVVLRSHHLAFLPRAARIGRASVTHSTYPLTRPPIV